MTERAVVADCSVSKSGGAPVCPASPRKPI